MPIVIEEFVVDPAVDDVDAARAARGARGAICAAFGPHSVGGGHHERKDEAPAFAEGAELQIIDDQRGLRSVMNIQPGFGSDDFDLDLRPFTRRQVNVTFIFFGKLFSKFLPREVRVGNVLS